jgi:hypothetical protein
MRVLSEYNIGGRNSPTNVALRDRSRTGALDLAVDALAVFRLTRLLVADAILEEPRARALVKLETTGHPKLGYLLGCPWCISPYIAAAAIVARRRAPRGWDPVARALAFSAVAGIIHTVTSPSE